MSTLDYIPQTDAGRRDFAVNMATHVSAEPSLYGLVPADAATIQAYVDAFVDAYAIAADPATRTASTIAAKDAARAAMLGTIRPFAQRIAVNDGVSNAAKLDLGLRIRKTTPTPVPMPSSSPVLTVVSSTVRGQHVVRFTDSEFPTSRAKPIGATGMQLSVGRGAEPLDDPDATKIVATVTRQPYTVTYPATDKGKVATYFARWVTARGEWGVWSGPASLIISF